MEELVKQAKNGDVEAFAGLYEEVYQDLYRFAYYLLGQRQEAEDVVSETVMDAFLGIRSLRREEAFKSWICKILSNKCKKRLKQYEKNAVTMETPEGNWWPDMEENYELKKAFMELEARDRQIIVMSVFAGFTSKEIARLLHSNTNTIRSRKSRALQKMKDALAR